MKKGVIALLVLLAVVVLVSPAIVGRLAEKSMDENINWAASESGEVKVTSEKFTRGWFSSEGQHRVELRDGELLTAIQAFAGPTEADDLPILVISTKLDHGLIPVSSLSREKGSLAPGLGSAVSTLQVEMPDGETIEVPGTIYSKVSLGGELLSSYVVEAGSKAEGDASISWEATSVDVNTNPSSGVVSFDGSLGALEFTSGNQAISLSSLTFAGEQRPTPVGLYVGDATFEVEGFSFMVDGNKAGGLESMSVVATSELEDDRLNGDATMAMALHNLPQIGDLSVDMVFSLRGADAAALARIEQSAGAVASNSDPMSVVAAIERDARDLFAAGFELDFDQLDISLPQGTVKSTISVAFGEEDPATFAWTSLLLNTEASVNLSVPEALVNLMVEVEPNVAMAIGGGYLVKRGESYEMVALLKKGLLTVNGAPIPIPVGATR